MTAERAGGCGSGSCHYGQHPTSGDRGKWDGRFYPTILGATNGKTWPGAEFDLTALIGTSAMLGPGTMTGAFMLRIKASAPTDPMIGRMMTFVSAGTRGE